MNARPFLLLHCLMLAIPVQAAPLQTSLTVRRADSTQVKAAFPNAHPPAQRPALSAQANERLTLEWQVASATPTPAPDVLIHFFVARQNKSGEQNSPVLSPTTVILEGALTMDFKEKSESTAHLDFRIPRPGSYEARVETEIADASPLEQPVVIVDLEIR